MLFGLSGREDQPDSARTRPLLLPISGIRRVDRASRRYYQDIRQQGVARVLMLRAIEDSREAGNATLCLQTRADSFQERFYQQLGFEVLTRRNRVVRITS